MRTKINGKIYDTEAAHPLAIYSSYQPVGSLFHFSEVLYIKQDGEYFLHGKGEAMTHYAKRYKNRNASGETIVPMTKEQAKEWAKRFCARVVYREIFGVDAA